MGSEAQKAPLLRGRDTIIAQHLLLLARNETPQRHLLLTLKHVAPIGTVDKYLGDGVMALFGAPLGHGDADDARRAVTAGLAICSVPREIAIARPDLPEVEIKVGINTGRVVAGGTTC